MKLLNNFFKENKSDIAIEKVQKLSNKLIHGLSTENDIAEWEANLELIEMFKEKFNKLFLMYLLKHYPNDKRLNEKYHDGDSINDAKDAMYREVLLQIVGDALYMLKYKRKDFLFIGEGRCKYLIDKIEEYVYFEKKNKEILLIKKNDISKSLLEQELEYILNALKDSYALIPCKTLEQKEWYVRANHIDSFKYLEHDVESIFSKRYKLGLKHGFLLGDIGSGKTRAVQKEIELILKNTNDDIIVIDNDGMYEEFCHKNNGEYINAIKDYIFFDNKATVINNRLIILDIHSLNNAIKFEYASKALKYAYKRINEQSEYSKITWLYIEEANDLIFDDYFLTFMSRCIRKGVITIVTNRVTDIIENPNICKHFSKSSYIRLFRQSPNYRKSLAKFLSIDSDKLEFYNIETSWAIIGSKLIKIKDKL
ncbi:MAG: TraG P-loop domain [Clostridiaceae bacterium]|nr:TraG P-loop domain [Clostridiaceae bacterium]